MRAKGHEVDAITIELLAVNAARCQPPLDESEVRKIAEGICRRYEPEPGADTSITTVDLPLTDLGNAERFVEQNGHEIRRCPQIGKWIVWSKRLWAEDVSGAVQRRAAESIRDLGAYAQQIVRQASADRLAKRITDDEARRIATCAGQISGWALKSEAAERMRALISLAESLDGVYVDQARLDAEPWLLNCANGVIDLRIGELKPHDPKLLITKCITAAFDSAARAPRWETFIHEIMDGREELVTFLKRLVGYCMSGDTRERCVFVLWGKGRNGKSVFLEVLRALLGDYSRKANIESFLARRDSSGANNDIARLRGARFVYASESGEGRRLNEALIKDLTGRESVTARFLFHEYFEFMPQFKLVLGTNFKPEIRGTDAAIWDRIRLIPFDRRFEGAAEDKDLALKLQCELSGVLRWAVEGCLEWQREGLGEPVEVTGATKEYRTEQDVVGEFLEERCETNPQALAGATPLFKAFKGWLEEGGRESLSQAAFGTRLTMRGVVREKIGGHKFYRGIKLLEGIGK